MKKQNDYSFILKHGVTVYPVYQSEDVYIGNELVYARRNWYIEVNNNNSITRYKKSIGHGSKLNSEKTEKQINATIKHWVGLIKKKLKDGIN